MRVLHSCAIAIAMALSTLAVSKTAEAASTYYVFTTGYQNFQGSTKVTVLHQLVPAGHWILNASATITPGPAGGVVICYFWDGVNMYSEQEVAANPETTVSDQATMTAQAAITLHAATTISLVCTQQSSQGSFSQASLASMVITPTATQIVTTEQ